MIDSEFGSIGLLPGEPVQIGQIWVFGFSAERRQQQNNFYAEINNGIGLFDLETNELVNPSVVEQQDNTIAASVFDTINGLFYITTTDFFSTGKGTATESPVSVFLVIPKFVLNSEIVESSLTGR